MFISISKFPSTNLRAYPPPPPPSTALLILRIRLIQVLDSILQLAHPLSHPSDYLILLTRTQVLHKLLELREFLARGRAVFGRVQRLLFRLLSYTCTCALANPNQPSAGIVLLKHTSYLELHAGRGNGRSLAGVGRMCELSAPRL